MSAILGIVLPTDGVPGATRDAAKRMLAAMAARGSDRAEVWEGEGVVLGVSRTEWEMGRDFSDGVLVAVDDDVAVAADASIFYRADLARAVRAAGVEPRGNSPAALIAATYRAWGEACVDHLEGDFAFLVWDRRRRRLFGARDFIGMRTLRYGVFGGELVAASTPGGVAAHPRCSGAINLAAVARAAANFYGDDTDSVYEGVSSLPAGFTVSFQQGAGSTSVRRYWNAPAFAGEETPGVPFEEAAEELRRLLTAAVVERMTLDDVTAITLSGGWDSPVLFACGQNALRERGLPAERLFPVSLSYPVGDSGREDELISDIAHFWGLEPSWIDARGLDMFDRLVERASKREEPFGHLYESVNRALAAGGRAVGGRALLNGFGGDTLFHLDPSYLSDLLLRGRLVEFAREWRANRLPYRPRTLFQMAVQPRLTKRGLAIARRLRGGPLDEELVRTAPPWMREDFLNAHRLNEREEAMTPMRHGEEAHVFEKRWMLEYQFFPRLHASIFELSFDEGVEVRCPFNDSRVLAFAATRPRAERRSRGETKRLSRAAVRGLLPDHVLAPRPKRTGTPVSYFQRWYWERFPVFATAAFGDPVLAEAGIVDSRRLQRETNRLVNNGSQGEQLALYLTLQAELWLRARQGRQIPENPPDTVVTELTAASAARS